MAKDTDVDDSLNADSSLVGPPVPWQEERPDAPEEKIRLFDPEERSYFAVPVEHVETALQRGAVPAWDKSKPPQEWAPWESALAGVGQGGLLGHGDEAFGAVGALAQAAADRSLEGFGEHYRQNRDEARQRLSEAEVQNPKSFLGGQLVGAGTTALLAPGGLPAAVGLGALQGEGNSTAETAGGLAKDTALGGAGGAAGYGIGSLVGKGLTVAAPAVKTAAGKALLKGAGINPRDLGVPSEEAVQLGKAALDEPGVVPGMFERQGATAEHLAQTSAQGVKNAGEALGAGHEAFDAIHGPTVSARALAEEIRDVAAPAVRIKPEMARHAGRAIRQIDPEAFDNFERGLVMRLEKARWLEASLKEAAASDPTITPAHISAAVKAVKSARTALKAFGKDPSLAYSDQHLLTQAETQAVINRLKGLGAHAGSPGETPITAKDSVLSPAWNTGAQAIRKSAAAFGGDEALAAENAARERYGNIATFNKAAETAATRQGGAPKPTAGLAEVGKAAIAHAVDPHLGAAVLAGQAAKAVTGSRQAAMLNAASKALPQMGEKTADLLRSHGALFSSHAPERRIALDHKLQELSPSYRAKRRAAEEEQHAIDNKGR